MVFDSLCYEYEEEEKEGEEEEEEVIFQAKEIQGEITIIKRVTVKYHHMSDRFIYI